MFGWARRRRSANPLSCMTFDRAAARPTSIWPKSSSRVRRTELNVANHKKVLGRGLGALIPQRAESATSVGLAQIPLEQISPNPYQPRKSFNEASIDELARSVREH